MLFIDEIFFINFLLFIIELGKIMFFSANVNNCEILKLFTSSILHSLFIKI